MKYFPLLVLLFGCHSPRTRDLELEPMTQITGALPTDSAVLARLTAAEPCRRDLPPVRHNTDSLSAAIRCTLLSTALATIEARRGAPEVFADLPVFNGAAVRCALVRVDAYRNERTGEMDLTQWTVEFFSDHQPPLAVEIDRLTGQSRTLRILEEFGFIAAQICA